MLITFTSISNLHEKNNKIEFTSPVFISEWNGYKVYEFDEPTLGEKNRIEVREEEINIIAGRNTLNLSLGEKIDNEYIIPGKGSIWLKTQLHKVKIVDNKINFSYSLFQDGVELSIFDLQLLIKEN